MDTEIELKLLVGSNANTVEKVIQILQHSPDLIHEYQCVELSNSYFDTPDKAFRQMDMGFRVRGKNGSFQQTIKTAGKVSAGLHSRPEYNIELENDQPNLELFQQDIWPENVCVADLQKNIQPLFTTHFERHIFDIQLKSTAKIELVVDLGNVQSGVHQAPISEVELELKQGAVEDLFELALLLTESLNVRLGKLSKAARGYMLLAGQELQPLPPPEPITLNDESNLEQGVMTAIEHGLNYWQHHEQCYVETSKASALQGILRGISLVKTAVDLYSKVLPCKDWSSISQLLEESAASWEWLEPLLALKQLKAKKGPYRKGLSKYDSLVSYFCGRYQGELIRYNPQEIILKGTSTRAQLSMMQMLQIKPWRQESDNWQRPLLGTAKDWLNDSWEQVQTTMPLEESFGINAYLHSEPLLRKALFGGLLVSDLFASQRRSLFRAPWLDIIDGIDELKVLSFLQSELEYADVDDEQAIRQWSDEKIQHLLEALEQSRKAALSMEPYWQ